MQYLKVPATPENRRNFKQLAGMVFPAELVPDGCESRAATPFEVLTQTKAFSIRGANMGRPNIGPDWDDDPQNDRVFDRYVSLDSGGYDQGGAYWGHGGYLRVRYTKDMAYVRYYREEWQYEIQGFYSKEYGYECVTTETTILDAREQLACYRENEPGISFRMKKVRVLPS